MHHYTSSTCYTMTDDTSLWPVWQIELPKHAFTNGFLLHGVLAIAALHKRLSASAHEHMFLTGLARIHQQQALATYIPLMQGPSNINKENCHALFAFSAMLGTLTYALMQDDCGSSTPNDLLTKIVDIFDLFAGTVAIATTGKEWLYQGTLAPLLDPSPLANHHDLRYMRDGPRQALENIIEFAVTNTLGSASTIEHAIKLLAPLFPTRNNYLGMDLDIGAPSTLGVSYKFIIGWPVFAGRHFVGWLRNREPLALVVLTYYGAAIHENGDVWSLKGVGRLIVDAVVGALGDEWLHLLEWAVRTTRTGQAALVEIGTQMAVER